MTPYITSAILGLAIGFTILWLVRRDQMHGSYAVWWIVVALASVVIGFFPQVVDRVGILMGVQYPPMLLVLVAIAVILFKLLGVDIDVTRREQRLRRLLQKVAILELELNTLKAKIELPAQPQTARERDVEVTVAGSSPDGS